MRKEFLIAAASAAILCSCSKEQVQGPEACREKVTMTVSLPQALSKAVSESSEETAVNSFQVYVFNSDGSQLESYAVSSSSSATLSVSLGDKLVAALVNYDETRDVTDIDALKAKMSDLSDNADGGFVMFGTADAVVSANSSVVVPVRRLVARVVISKVTNAIDIPQYMDSPVILKGIALVNAGGSTNLSADRAPSADSYYNRMGTMSDLPMLLSRTFSESIANDESFTGETRLYCYPNPVMEDNTSETWSPRFTRLVVTVEIAGRDWYYPVSLGSGVEANNSYEVQELKITRLGSTSPDQPLEIDSASFTVTVKPWVVTDMSTVTI